MENRSEICSDHDSARLDSGYAHYKEKRTVAGRNPKQDINATAESPGETEQISDQIAKQVENERRQYAKPLEQGNQSATALKEYSRDACLDIRKCMENEPPEREEVVKGMIPLGACGVMSSQGGVGKTNLVFLLGALVACGRSEKPFFIPAPQKVVIVNVEDSPDDIWRRLHALGKQYRFTDEEKFSISLNLIVYPGRGEIGPMMRFENGNPVETEDAGWLRNIIGAESPSLMIYDTKSRLYGLNENDNDHAAQWWRMIESTLVAHPGCSHLVVTHVSKAAAESTGQTANRGASAFIDNARYCLVLQGMTEKQAEKYDVERGEYFSLHMAKNNYNRLSKPVFFRKVEEGVPVSVDLEENQYKKALNRLLELIEEKHEGSINQRELLSTGDGKEIRETLKNEYGLNKNDIKSLVNYGIDEGPLVTITDDSSPAVTKPILIRVRR